MNRAAYHDAARGMYRRTKLTSAHEVFMAVNNVAANIACDDEDVQLCLTALLNAAGDLEQAMQAPAPELSAFAALEAAP